MAIRGNKKGLEFYFKIVELRLIEKVKVSVKTTDCLYQAALFKYKAASDENDSNALLKIDFQRFELGQRNNFQQQAYAHLRDYLADDFIEDVLDNGQQLKINNK
jgi:hypothetical protein